MSVPYYADGDVVLFHGDCHEITDWLAADVLVTDPPYGIGWRRGLNKARASSAHSGIVNDQDVTCRDEALAIWGKHHPSVVFGSFYAPPPADVRQWLIYRKPINAGVVGSTTGYRRDAEPVYLLGPWPKRTAQWSSVLFTHSSTGNVRSPQRQNEHPHAKPLDVMEALISACPPGVIADPFAGSGSTLVAARNLGRKAIGVEIDERYCEVAARRLAADCLPLEVTP